MKAYLIVILAATACSAPVDPPTSPPPCPTNYDCTGKVPVYDPTTTMPAPTVAPQPTPAPTPTSPAMTPAMQACLAGCGMTPACVAQCSGSVDPQPTPVPMPTVVQQPTQVPTMPTVVDAGLPEVIVPTVDPFTACQNNCAQLSDIVTQLQACNVPGISLCQDTCPPSTTETPCCLPPYQQAQLACQHGGACLTACQAACVGNTQAEISAIQQAKNTAQIGQYSFLQCTFPGQ